MKVLTITDDNLFYKEMSRSVDRDRDFMSVSLKIYVKSGAIYSEDYGDIINNWGLGINFSKADSLELWEMLKDTNRDEFIDCLYDLLMVIEDNIQDHDTYQSYLDSIGTDNEIPEPLESKNGWDKIKKYKTTAGKVDLLQVYNNVKTKYGEARFTVKEI